MADPTPISGHHSSTPSVCPIPQRCYLGHTYGVLASHAWGETATSGRGGKQPTTEPAQEPDRRFVLLHGVRAVTTRLSAVTCILKGATRGQRTRRYGATTGQRGH